MNGTILVRSELNKGATFTVEIPVNAEYTDGSNKDNSYE